MCKLLAFGIIKILRSSQVLAYLSNRFEIPVWLFCTFPNSLKISKPLNQWTTCFTLCSHSLNIWSVPNAIDCHGFSLLWFPCIFFLFMNIALLIYVTSVAMFRNKRELQRTEKNERGLFSIHVNENPEIDFMWQVRWFNVNHALKYMFISVL